MLGFLKHQAVFLYLKPQRGSFTELSIFPWNIPLSSSLESSTAIHLRLWEDLGHFLGCAFDFVSPDPCKIFGLEGQFFFVATSRIQWLLPKEGLGIIIFRIVLPACCSSSSWLSWFLTASLASPTTSHINSNISQQFHLIHGRCFFIWARRPTATSFSAISVVSRYCLLG